MGTASMIRLRNGDRHRFPDCLASLSEDSRYQDTVLVCQDGEVRASRFILTLCLPFLRRPLRDREEDEVVIVMPNFKCNLIKDAMFKVFRASETIYEGRDNKSNFIGLENNLPSLYSQKEESDIKRKDEDFLQIKHEVDSENDQNMEEQEWEPHEKEALILLNIVSRDEKDDNDEDCEEDMWEMEEKKPKAYKTIKKRSLESSDINWNCQICDKHFANRTEYKKHEDETHVQDGMIVCPYENCDKRYRVTETRYGQSRLIVRHIERHRSKRSEGEYVCSECGKTFKNRRSLVPHMLLHTGIKNHQCEVCNQMFCSRSNLLSHKAQSKCGAEEVVCPTCGKKCSNKYYLKRHIVRHTAERQFKCEFEGCGKSFFDQHVLRSHEKIHLGIKDFHCSLCPKQFTQSQQLSVHMKRHNGVKQIFHQLTSKSVFIHFLR